MVHPAPFRLRLVLTIGFSFILLLAPGALRAQGTTATVTGFVTDSSGAKLPGATVSFTNTATGVAETATTNSAGLYRIQGLLPGNYKSAVTVSGFKTAVREGIDLHLEDQVSLDYALDIGATSESVTVEAGGRLLEASTPTVSQVIEGRQVQDTPLNGRNAMNLIALTPGVVPQGSTGGSANNNANNGAFTNVFGFGNYQIAGGLANQQSTYVDGAPVDAFEGHVVSFIPSQDSVQEFRVESSVVNPQYGEFSGGIVSFGTKSGANALHGTAYDYLRNTIFNANNFFLSGLHQPRPAQIQNQFGATAGGPIKKDRAFFYASYESIRTALGVPNLGRVPTAAELQGNFTADPAVVNPAPYMGKYIQAKCNGVLNEFCLPGQPSQPGDAIYDPTSYYMANVAHYFPLPNTTNAGAAYNYSQTGKAFSTLNTYDLRGDLNVGARQKIFAKYGRLDGFQQGTQFIFNNPTGPNSGAAVGRTVTNYVFGDTVSVNPTSVVDIRLSYLRYFSFFIPSYTNLAAFGPFYAGIANQVIAPVFPNVSITNNVTQPYGQLSSFSYQPINQYALSGTYSKLLGRHSLSFGGEVRERDEYYINVGNSTGNFVFGGTNTACIPSATKSCAIVVAPGSGVTPVADFVSGHFTSAGAGIPNADRPDTVNHYGGLFANDIFQLSPRLTLSAGIRYEIPGGNTEKHNNNAVILPQLANPLTVVNTSAYPSRSDLVTHLKLFSPRVGFSFQPYTGTTVRAGYSLAYLPQEIVFAAAPAGSSVNSPTTYVAPGGLISAPLGYLPGTTTPNTTILKPIGRGYATNPTYLYGQVIAGRDPYYKFPYLQQWNGNVQQSFGSSAIMQLAYLGSRGDHLAIANTYNINQLPDNATLAAANRPYPQYQNVNVNSAWIGDTYYNSLQATLTKRFTSGGTLLANYSWSKFLGTADSLNPQVETHAAGAIQDYDNPRGERSYTSFDVPHRLVISYILDLPVGNGKRFLGNADGIVNGLVSGWNVSGINSFQSGFPLAITTTASTVSSAYGGGTTRPNVVPGCNKKLAIGYVAAAQQQKPILNAACFTAPVPPAGAVPIASNYFGNEPRTDGLLRTQGIDNWDFSIGKTTPIRESINLVFRAEAFNVTNRVQFGDPGLSAASATFGVFTTQANLPRSFQFSLRLNY